MNATATTPPPVDLVVRGGTVVGDTWTTRADVVVAGGRVLALTAPSAAVAGQHAGTVVLDASGKLVLPGGVDPHCHVDMTNGSYTTRDDYARCTTAAVFGGTTTIIDFAIPHADESPADAAYARRAKAAGGLCDVALHGCVVHWDTTVPEQLAAMVADGIGTVKMFTTYRGDTMADEDTILRTMQVLRDLGGMALVHCEANHIIEEYQSQCAEREAIDSRHMADSRPELAETASVAEVLAIAESVKAAVYLVHQSTAGAVELVAAARRRGMIAYSETVAHYLLLDDSAYLSAEPERFVCCPPLRPAQAVRELARHLFTGEITTIGSDHCCYDLEQKRSNSDDVRRMPNGLPGVETRLPVIFSEYVVGQGLPVSRFVELTSTAPARTNGLAHRKGSLLPGADADIAIWNSGTEWTVSASTLHMATDYTPYEGMPVTGRPETVVVGGRIVVAEGELVDTTPAGRFLPGVMSGMGPRSAGVPS